MLNKSLLIVKQPYLTNLDNKFAILNEFSVSIYLYAMMGLAFTTDVIIMDKIGLTLLGILVITVAVNILKAIYVDGKAIIQRI